MADSSDNLVLEHPRAIRATLDTMGNELRDVRHRVSPMERHLANLQAEIANVHLDMANVHLRLDYQGERLDRIERRFELVDSSS